MTTTAALLHPPASPFGDAAGLLAAIGVCEHALRAGDMAPDVSLPDATGTPTRLSDLWRGGPLVVVFYRGGWCSYCNLQLHAWQQHADEMKRRGATLVAISPQTPDHSQGTAEANALAYPVLSDSNLDAANGFRIAFTLPPEMIDYYASVGTDIPVLNGNAQWVLPIPATYLIDTTGRIRFSHVELDYREPAQPAAVLAMIEQMDARNGSD